ncbi:MAG: adenylate/guanylate cyclase domain-containing protein [Opitutaceae bacterium]|nr:adenylate/guanylate cyclase domain-containing protein [Opitutaceae bacterium]
MASAPQFTRRTWLVLVLISTAWGLAAFTGGLDVLERWTTDLRFRLRGEIPSPIPVVYVDVDSRSIADLGNQPWDRAYFAEVANALVVAGKARAVGIDYVFSDNGIPDLVDRLRFDEGRRTLAEYLNSDPPPPVVVAASYAAPAFRDINLQLDVREFPRVGTPPEEADMPELPEFRMGGFVVSAPYVGLIDTIDGDTREVHAFAEVGPMRWHHLAIELMRLYWQLPRENVTVEGGVLRMVGTDGRELSRIPLRDGQDLHVNWFSRWNSKTQNPHYSFSQALVCARALSAGNAEERRIAEEFFSSFKDTVVLIGPVDPLLQDLATTPLDRTPVPRVSLHGNLAKTIASGRHLVTLPLSVAIILQVLLTVAVAIPVLATGRRAGLLRFMGAAALLLYLGVAVVGFNRFDWVLPVALPVGSALTAALAALAIQVVSEEKQKRRIQGLFGTYLSPELVGRMVDSGDEPRLGGEEVEITAFFSDIENFTTLAESLPPTTLVELMNDYLTECTDAVTDSGGTLDKYVGDAVVAMFGAPVSLPDHAWRACSAACRMQERLNELRARMALDKVRWPQGAPVLRTRIGLNSGSAVVGNMGSATRFNYTMIGDTVNLAARLESAGKAYGVGILVSDTTRKLCIQSKDTLLFRPVDRLVVKGRSQPVTVYELVGFREKVDPDVKRGVELFTQALEAVWIRDWARAGDLLAQSAPLEAAVLAGDKEALTPTVVFQRRLEKWNVTPPPENWGGVWVAEKK